MANTNIRITLIIGASVDGKVTYKNKGSSKEFGENLSKKMNKPLTKWRNWADAIMVSRKTILYDNPSLSIPNRLLTKIVVDRTLKLPLTKKFFDGSTKTIVFKDLSVEVKKRYPQNVVLVNVNFKEKGSFKKALVSTLKEYNIRNLLVEGGGKFNAILLENQIIDTLAVAYFPFLIGGRKTPTILDGEGIQEISNAIKS